MSVTDDDARRVGDELRVNWKVVPVETFRTALATELEHTDVTHGDLETTGRIALAHLREDPGYYARLARLEAEADAYWATRVKPSPTLGGGERRFASACCYIAIILLLMLLIVCLARRLCARSSAAALPGKIQCKCDCGQPRLF